MKKFKAFSILEAALALLLVGIFSSFLIPYWNLLNLQHNIIKTKNHANYIRKAVQAYVCRYGFLPYAADKHGVSIDGLIVGEVPYKELGISKRYVYNSYGKKFQYFVNENLCLKRILKENRKIWPVTMPLNIHPNNYFTAHFCRLYTFKAEGTDLDRHTQESKIIKFVQINEAGECNNLNKEIINLTNGAIWVNTHKNDKKRFIQLEIWHQDLLDETKNLNLIKNKTILQRPVNYIFGNFVNFSKLDDAVRNKIEQMPGGKVEFIKNHTASQKNSKNSHLFKNEDIVAWALVNKKTKSLKLNSGYCVFWQSRFNLAGSINCPCLPISGDYTIQYNSVEKEKIKKAQTLAKKYDDD